MTIFPLSYGEKVRFITQGPGNIRSISVIGFQSDVRVYDEVILSQGPSRLARLAKWGTKLISHNVQNLAGDLRAFDNDLHW